MNKFVIYLNIIIIVFTHVTCHTAFFFWPSIISLTVFLMTPHYNH